MPHIKKFGFLSLSLACCLGAPSLRAQSMTRGSAPGTSSSLAGSSLGATAAGGPGTGVAVPAGASSAAAIGATAVGGGGVPAAMAVGASSVYRVSPNDVVEVRVYQEDDLLTTARVSQEGTIKFPLIGSVKIAGQTSDGAAQLIGAELAKDYLVNPQVSVKVIEFASRRFTVLGQVGKPGVYEMPASDTITLLEAIGDAGGFTRIANLGDIRLKRVVSGKDTQFRLSAKEGANSRQNTSFEIKPGDIITVGESFF